MGAGSRQAVHCSVQPPHVEHMVHRDAKTGGRIGSADTFLVKPAVVREPGVVRASGNIGTLRFGTSDAWWDRETEETLHRGQRGTGRAYGHQWEQKVPCGGAAATTNVRPGPH